MAEDSRPWSGAVTGDCGPYADDDWTDVWEPLTSDDNATKCVLRNILNELEVTGVASPVTVATGKAFVDGTYYENTSAVTVAVPNPAVSTRVDLIVLEKDWVAQTVRIARVAGVEGAGAPAVTQIDGTTWQVVLAEASIDIGGTIVVTDSRGFINLPIAVGFDDSSGDPESLGDSASDGTSEFAPRLDHVHPARADRLVLDERGGGDPADIANTGQIYTKDDGSGNTELYFVDESGNVQKLSGAGLVLLDEDQVVGVAQANFTLTIPAGYRGLKILGTVQPATNGVNLEMQFNGDTGNNYGWAINGVNELGQSNPSTGSGGPSTDDHIELGQGWPNTAPFSFTIDIPVYAGTTFEKNSVAQVTGSGDTLLVGGVWSDSAAITQIVLAFSAGNIEIGSEIYVYGYPA